jgi:hypothetical protein
MPELEKKEEEIMRIFLKDHYSIIEASRIYSPDLPATARNHRTVAYYFYRWKKDGWIDTESILREVPSKKHGGTYPSRCPRYRLNTNFYFDLRKYNPKSGDGKKFKEFVNEFLHQDVIRNYVLKSKSPLIQTIDKLLFLLVRMAMEYHYNEQISEWFPTGTPWGDNPEKWVNKLSKFPKKDRFNATLWLYAFLCVCNFNQPAKLMSKLNPLLSEYEHINTFWYRASKGKYFQK